MFKRNFFHLSKEIWWILILKDFSNIIEKKIKIYTIYLFNLIEKNGISIILIGIDIFVNNFRKYKNLRVIHFILYKNLI